MDLIETYGYEITTEKLSVVLLGDIHYGHKNCARDELEKYIRKIQETKNCYVILMGDLLEYTNLDAENRGVGGGQVLDIPTQRKEMTKLLKPISDKILAIIEGNHEERALRSRQESPIEVICDILKVPNGKDMCFVQLHTPSRTYTILAIHGRGFSQTAEYLPNKYYKNFIGFDILAIGHSHLLADGERYRLGPNDYLEKSQWVRTGSFLKYPRYARNKGYAIVVIGAPKIQFDNGLIEIRKRWVV